MKRQLSILDLMIAMAAVAVTLVLQKNLADGQDFSNCTDPIWSMLFFSHAVTWKALVLFGMPLLGHAVLSARNTDKSCLWHPGHVLLLSQFLFLCQGLGVAFIFGDTISPYSGKGLQMDMVLQFFARNGATVISMGATLTAAVIGGAIFKWNWIWVSCLALLSLLAFMNLASQAYISYSLSSAPPSQLFGPIWEIFNAVIQFSMLFAGAFVFAAAIHDLVKGAARDIPHWIGVASWVVGSLGGYLLFRTALLALTPEELFGL